MKPPVDEALQQVSPPPTVFLPAAPGGTASDAHSVELRMIDDVLVVVAFSSLQALVRGCGPNQPWVAMRAEDVDEMRDQWAAAAVLLDPMLGDPPAETDGGSGDEPVP